MKYVDGYVVPIPTRNVKAYKSIAQKAGKIWREHGALDYCESVAEDTGIEGVVSFLQLAGAKKGETVIFAYIVYKSRAHRDKVNAKVMQDPRMAKLCGKKIPFDAKKMAFSGFNVLVKV